MSESKRVSTSSGKKPGQKYQNTFSYKHNRNSKKTKKIAASPIQGLCARCTEVIEWRKKFRKYKPLTTPKRCVGCQEKAIKDAYHILCDPCARTRGVCAKCQEKKEIVPAKKTAEDEREEQLRIERVLGNMRERERRAFLRKMEKGEAPPLSELPEDDDSDGFDLGSSDEDSESAEEEEDEEKVEEEDDEDSGQVKKIHTIKLEKETEIVRQKIKNL
ncbi:uncharacterized protein VTP21DRAFT_1197 [Calcarisporiella thermophila]|uniref:uncharacterized protein n=1 Tax=Calcarisporiella thermophila TaxID=911321 RepID=UPI0037440450